MKLNPNCIRDILLVVEDKCTFENPWEYQRDACKPRRLAQYDHSIILYHIRQAEKSDLIEGVDYYDEGDAVLICDLTPKGHEFLSNIRNDSIWKRVISKASDASLPILFEVAKEVALKHFLGRAGNPPT